MRARVSGLILVSVLAAIAVAVEVAWLSEYLKSATEAEEDLGAYALVAATLFLGLGFGNLLLRHSSRWLVFGLSATLSLFLLLVAYICLTRW